MTSPNVERSRHVWVWHLALAVMVLAYLALGALEGRFILRSSANVPISDTWNFVPVLARFARTGHVAWRNVFGFYGDGRPVLERIGLLVSARFFSLDVQSIKLLSIPVGLLEAACAVCAFRWALPRSRLVVVLVVTYPVAIVIFGLNNWQNLLDEWNLMNLAAVALTFLGILLAVEFASGGRRRLLLAILLVLVCVAASFTGESGTLSWIACALVIWLPPTRCRLADRIAFSATGVVFLVLYFAGTGTLSSGHPLGHLGTVLEFAFICLGNGIVGGVGGGLALARAVGIAEVAVALVVLAVVLAVPRLRGDRAARVAVGLIVFGGMGAVATGVSRLQIGLGTAMSSRYVVLTAPVAIAIYLVSVRMVALQEAGEQRGASRLRTAGLLAVPCLVAAGLSALAIVSDLNESRASKDKSAYYLSLQEMACNPTAFSDKRLSRFDHSGGLDGKQKAQLLAQIADLRRGEAERVRRRPLRALRPLGSHHDR